MYDERRNPSATIVIRMRDGGETLTEFGKHTEIKSVLVTLRSIVRQLEEVYHLKHNDIHPNNVLVSSTGQVSIIDFGWCTCLCFDMCAKEQHVHERACDWEHFVRSLKDPEFGLEQYYEYAQELL
jgi:RIO-like serine/threonine protein kinase